MAGATVRLVWTHPLQMAPQAALLGAMDTALPALRTTLDRIGRAETPIAAAGSVPPGDGPGRLLRELQVTAQRSGPVGTVTLATETSYARWVLEGRGPITAGRGKALAFWVGGHRIFRKRVGPQAANPFIDRAFERWWPQAQGQIQELVARFAGLLLREG